MNGAVSVFSAPQKNKCVKRKANTREHKLLTQTLSIKSIYSEATIFGTFNSFPYEPPGHFHFVPTEFAVFRQMYVVHTSFFSFAERRFDISVYFVGKDLCISALEYINKNLRRKNKQCTIWTKQLGANGGRVHSRTNRCFVIIIFRLLNHDMALFNLKALVWWRRLHTVNSNYKNTINSILFWGFYWHLFD